MSRTRIHKGTAYPVSDAHPAAEAFPWVPEDELQAMADDIREHGQKIAIRRLPDGRVFDGRNRELACRIAGVEPQYRDEEFTEEEVLAFVRSTNLHRRDLDKSQRAAVAAELHKLAGVPQYEAAPIVHVSERLVNGAVKVLNASPALHAQVKSGQLPVTTAQKVAALDPEVRELVAASADPRAAAREALEEAFEELTGDADDDAPLAVEPEENPAALRDLGADVTEADIAALKTKRLPKWMKPGNNSDPDHPYAELLNALTNLNRVLKKTILNDETGVLKDNLIEMRHVKLPPLPWLRFTSGKVENGVQVAEPEMRLVWSYLLRSLVRKSGKRNGRMSLAGLMKFTRETLEKSVEAVVQEEGEE